MFLEDDFFESSNIPPPRPNIFDSPVIGQHHNHHHHHYRHNQPTQQVAYERTISNDGRASNHSNNNNNNEEFPFRRRKSSRSDLPSVFPAAPTAIAGGGGVGGDLAPTRRDSYNGPQPSDEGTNYSPKPNPIYSNTSKERLLLRGRTHDSSSDEDQEGSAENENHYDYDEDGGGGGGGGGGAAPAFFYELDDWEHHNLANSAYDYDSDYYEDERMLLKWQARRLGLIYLGKEELEKHSQSSQLSEEERIHYLLGK